MRHLRIPPSSQTPRTRLTKLLLGALVLLVVADGIITRIVITQGLGIELNPFIKSWVGNGSFLWAKLAGALLAAFILWDLSGRDIAPGRLRSLIPIAFLVTFYAIIVSWNLYVLLVTA